jgi:hypothetical protein
VQQVEDALLYASEVLRAWVDEVPSVGGDPGSVIVLAAGQQNVRSLRFATEVLRGDREIVLAAVQHNGLA